MSSPTIVLVHGAFGDASSWRPVYDLLDGDEFTVFAPANPLRGVSSDASHLEAFIDQLDGPVLLVGHSYAGMVITVAGASDKVAGLVYVAGLVPDVGESVGDLQERFPSLAMGPILQQTPLPDGGVDLSVNPERFHGVFSADLSDADAWAVFGTADLPVAPELQRFEYSRAGSTVTEVEGASHFLMRSNPDVVAGVIRLAAMASTANPVA
jgi:pimeloyl-ACP methyl ester carboxylesterase